MLDSLKLLNDLCNERWASDSQTRWFYGTRCRDIPKGLITQVKRATKPKLAIQSLSQNFSSFYANTQCLERQEVRLLNENSTYYDFFFY